MTIGLRLCANGGLKIADDGLVLGCCDPCEITISRELERIQNLANLVRMYEYGEGLLVCQEQDAYYNPVEKRYYCRAAFFYEYRVEEELMDLVVLEYFDCENCEKIVVFEGLMNECPPYNFYPMTDICNGCIFKYKNPTLLTTIDASGPHEPTYEEPIIRSLYSYTNNTPNMQYIFWTEGGNVQPNERNVDNWAQILKAGQTPTEGENIYSQILYPNETATLYDINESHNTEYNPWELHCKVYMAEITCDPCEVAVYKKQYESEGETLRTEYGAGFFTGGGAHTPYQKAFTMSYNTFTVRLYGVTCDTCEIVLLDSWDAWDWEHVVPYTEDETACDGEGEVQ